MDTPSPTGLPMLPAAVVPYLATLVGVAAVLVNVLTPGTIAFQIASGVLAFGTVLGLASPGLRKALPNTAPAEAAGAAAAGAVNSQAAAVDALKGK